MQIRLKPVLLVGLCWFLSVGVSHAVSLGKAEVASHLGEPFYAEIPLQLDKDEKITRITVEMASPADYQILEVYYAPALAAISADVEDDARGIRVELNSRTAIEAPFLNVVLKVRYGRATHFKKIPVFLDLPKVVDVSKEAPVPTVSAVKSAEKIDELPVVITETETAPIFASEMESQDEQVTQGEDVQQATEDTAAPPQEFKPAGGWARIARYGPMVYGDTISTVAGRLRMDDRYTKQQVMVALFEKNRAKFDQDNINIIKAGTYLDVPTADEVERITPSQARAVITEHEKTWKELVRQPRYAAVAEAQKTRYSKRVRIGKNADGVAATPVPEGKDAGKQSQSGGEAEESDGGATSGPPEPIDQVRKDEASATAIINEKLAQELKALREQNEALAGQLQEAQKKVQDYTSQPASPELAAANERVKKLELQLARLQAERDQTQQTTTESGEIGWLTMALGGLVVLLLAAIGFLLRRERSHPANFDSTLMSSSDELAGGKDPFFSGGVTAGNIAPEIDVEEVEVEEVPAEGDADSAATVRMTMDEYEALPELTDEDTSEMEAFSEDFDDEPDPNVDYLAEADVYLRYGMEDEALKQVQMAVRQNDQNPDAHAKLVQLYQSKGDAQGKEAAIAAANATLHGGALSQFEVAVAALDNPEDGGVVDGLSDTLSSADASELAGSDELEMPGFEMPEIGEEEEAVSSASETSVDDSLEIPGFEIPEVGEESVAEDENISPEAISETLEETEAEESLSEHEAAADDGLEMPPIVETSPVDEEATLDMGSLSLPELDEEEDQGGAAEQPEAAEVENVEVEEVDGEDTLDFSTDDLGLDVGVKAEETSPAPAEEAEEDELDFSSLGFDSDEPAAAIEAVEESIPPVTAAPEADVSLDGDIPGEELDLSSEMEEIDLSGFDMGEEDSQAGEISAANADTGAFEDLDLDADDSLLAEPDASEQQAMASTVVSDWSDDTMLLGDDEDEGADEKAAPEEDSTSSDAEADIGSLVDEELATAAASSPSESDSSGAFDLDFDLAGMEVEKDDSVEADDFTSTIQTLTGDFSAGNDKGDEGESASANELDLSKASSDSDRDMDATIVLDRASMGQLRIDTGKSMLAEGDYDGAEASFKQALSHDKTKCDALLGMAQVAKERGDAAHCQELLAQAEPLATSPASRNWLNSLKG